MPALPRFLLCALACAPLLAQAQQAASPVHGNQPVTASVVNSCRILSIDGLMFGAAYNPIRNPAGSSASHQGKIRLSCTAGVAGWIGADSGSHAPSTLGDTCTTPVRRLHSVAGVYLDYALTYDQGGSDATWGCDSDHGPAFASVSMFTPVEIQTKATIPGGQDVPAGDYDDAMILTINF